MTDRYVRLSYQFAFHFTALSTHRFINTLLQLVGNGEPWRFGRGSGKFPLQKVPDGLLN